MTLTLRTTEAVVVPNGDGPVHRALRLADADLAHFAETYLRIQNKAGMLVPLTFNRIQRHLHARLEEQKARTGRVRAIVGKGRQGGVSTYVAARFYHRTILNPGVRTAILTHEQSATDKLFEMVDRFYQHCPLRPSTGTANAKELYFDRLDSGYSVSTAGTKAAGRSQMYRLLHWSEVAWSPNAAGHKAGIVQTVPDLPGTEIIEESTGNGVVGTFHEDWQQAEAGIGDYQAIFIPWFWCEDYSRPVPHDFRLDADESEYQRMHGLEMGQMVWRRAKIAELKNPSLFAQEYPATADEMFQASGAETFISANDVIFARKANLEGYGPLVIGADPARFGDDRFSIAWRQGRKVSKVESKTKIDVVAGANWIKQVIDRDKPARLFIDLGGLGAGTYDILQSWGEPYASIVVGINFGGEPQEYGRILDDGTVVPGPKNRRAEMWDRSRDWLQQPGGADIPDLDSLQADACGPTYSHDMGQRLVLESKEHMRARGLRSSDEWDAVCLTFAEPVKMPPPQAATPKRMSPQSGRLAWLGA